MKKTLLILSILFSLQIFANQIPNLTSPVMDHAQIIDNDQEIESKIRTLYNNGNGPQLTVLTINSLDGEWIESYANKAFTQWQLGTTGRNDGVLFIISVQDRKMRIEVGRGLEGSLTDLTSKRIIDSINNDFKNENYSVGINSGVDQIIEIASKPDAVQTDTQIEQSKKETRALFKIVGLVILSVIMFMIVFAFIKSYLENLTNEIFKNKKAISDSQEKTISYKNNTEKYNVKIKNLEQNGISLPEQSRNLVEKSKVLSAEIKDQKNTLSDLEYKYSKCSNQRLINLITDKEQIERMIKLSTLKIKEYNQLLESEQK